MMSPRLLLLIAVTTVSWSNAVERCVDCNLLPTKEASDIPRPASCSTTDCLPQEQAKPEIFTPWSKLGPVLQFDDAGIYYEPAELLPFDQVAFIPHPFYILNPAYQVDRRVSRTAIKLDENTEGTLSLNKHVSKSKHNKLDKHRKKEEIVHKKPETQFKKLPLYLDVELQEPRTETRRTPVVETHFENLKLAEQYLSICLDLHVLEFYRKNDSIFKNLKDVWNDTKFHYYDSLSDLDLEKEIIRKCNHSVDIVKKSLNEIKDTWPKNFLSVSSSRDFPTNARSGDINNQKVHIQSDGIISNASLVKTIFTPTNLTFTEQSTSAVVSIATTNTLTTDNIAKDTVLHTSNTYKNAGNQYQTALVTQPDQMHFDVTTASSVGSATLAETNLFIRRAQHPKVLETSHLPNFYVEDNFHLNSSFDPGHKHIKGNDDLFNYTNTSYANSKIYFIPMMQQTVHETTTPDIIRNTKSETVSGNEGFVTTSLYAENDNAYSEVNIQVSEIVTKEYPNDTAISSVEGLKHSLLTNNYILFKKDTSDVSVSSDTSTPMTTVNTVETTDNNKIMNSESHFPGEHLTGNLYFLYRNHSVPARFIQYPDGKISVGLDGYSLCDSVNDTTVKFIMLNVLCDCVKFKNCTNRS